MSACAMHKTFTVAIAPQGWVFDAPSGATLLQSAERSGLRLAASCRNGTCRTCMCRLTEGKVRYAIEWPGLSADEKRDGYILPCVAYPEADLVVDGARATRPGV
jgi:ferredoxin